MYTILGVPKGEVKAHREKSGNGGMFNIMDGLVR
jgi:hypothetical protein